MSITSHEGVKMSFRYLENVLSRKGNPKTILRCLEDVLCPLGQRSGLTQVKRKLISCIPNLVYDLPHELLNNLRLRKYSQILVETQLATKIVKLFLQIPRFTKTVEIFRRIPKFMDKAKIYSKILTFMETVTNFIRIPKFMETVKLLLRISQFMKRVKIFSWISMA